MDEKLTERTGFLFDESLDEADPMTARITAFEEARQVDKLIMIASESAAPAPVRAALASVFTDLYAEGYPAAHATREPEALLGDVAYQTAYHERYSDRRYYKGTEFADLVEALAQERVRAIFAPNRYPHNPVQIGPDQIQANVQPLSGANANTAVYLALLQPGDTIMGMNLAHGGHLSHGSPVNLSGRLYHVVAYGVDPATGQIDYDEVERLAREHNPRLIVSGASAYPWGIDFARLRQICDGLPRKAYLLADVSHPAGLVVAGLYPNPVGVADVTTFTTHKTLIGPRAAVILTTNESLARRIDRSVFPGLQGGPHMNTIAALAVAFKIAQTPAFDALQHQIVKNAKALAETLHGRGLALAYGGTESHLLLIDLRELAKPGGVPLNADVAARLLDLAGVVCNKNTIFGDVNALYPSGIRLGTPWITQRGLTESDMARLGGAIADVLEGTVTFAYFDAGDSAARGKVPVAVLKAAQATIHDLTARRAIGPACPAGWPEAFYPAPPTLDSRRLIEIVGRRARAFLAEATGGDVWSLREGEATKTTAFDADGRPLGTLALLRLPAGELGLERFVAIGEAEEHDDLVWWLKALSTGLVLFDPLDPWAKVDGPVGVAPLSRPLTDAEVAALRRASAASADGPALAKPYFVGQRALASPGASARPDWTASDRVDAVSSPITEPGGEPAPDGWTMPRSYGDPAAELAALRDGAGLVDESGLGILELSGPDAQRFLDLTTTNDVAFLARHAAQYTFLLDPRGRLLADAMLYRLDDDRYLLTTAPSRSSLVRDWLEAARSGRYAVDVEVPSRALPSDLRLADLRNATDDRSLAVLGLVGPNAPSVLRALSDGPEERRKIGRIRRFTLAAVRLAGTPTIVARTGHTGSAHGYEVFVPRSAARVIWEAALAKGAEQGSRPVGWAAWHAAGLAAGLPWLGGRWDAVGEITPLEAGLGPEVKAHKPFFVGRWPLLRQPYPPARALARFQVVHASDALPGRGDPLVSDRGICVGVVAEAPLLPAEPIGLALADRTSVPTGARFRIPVGLGQVRTVPVGEPVDLAVEQRPTIQAEVLPRFPK